MLINTDKALVAIARYIMLHQTHKYIHVTGSRKDFKKELLSQKKIKGQIRIWKELVTSFFWSPPWLWLFCGWDSTIVFLCLFLVLDSIPLFWLVALRMWFNSFLEALKMLTWCLHSKLDKMGRNGSTKKTGNRQLLHQERSCTLLQTDKISTCLGIVRGIFLSYISETNWNSQTLFVDILFRCASISWIHDVRRSLTENNWVTERNQLGHWQKIPVIPV